MIEIALDHDVVEAGGFVTGRVRWAGDPRVNRIIAAAQWETRGAGNGVWGVGRSTVFVPRNGAREVAFPVHMMIPHGGPVSFEGSLITIVWQLKVRIDQRGFDEFAQAPFRVEARKRQIKRM